MSRKNSTSDPTAKINLPDLYLEEDQDNFIYSIREEILERVSTQIDDLAIRQKSIEFVVDVACEALLKFLSMEFFFHNPSPDPLSDAWTADPPIPPSPPDTWAVGRVPIRPKPQELEQEEALEVEAAQCRCELSPQCACFQTPEERFWELEEAFHEAPMVPEDAGRSSTSSAGVSVGSEESRGGKPPSSVCSLREGYSKIGIAVKPVQLPKLDISMPERPVAFSKMVELPPIKLNAKFHSEPEVTVEKKKKKKRK